MQEQYTYYPKDGPGPSAKTRNEYLSVDNPDGPYYGIREQPEAVRKLQAIAFDALGKYNHVTNHVHVSLIGPPSTERTDLVRRHNKARMLPLVEITPSAVKTAQDVFVEISKVALAVGLPLIELGWEKHYVAPPMDIFVEALDALPYDILQSLGSAIEHGTLETEAGCTLDCKNIHWILAASDSRELFSAFDSRFMFLHTNRFVKLQLAVQASRNPVVRSAQTVRSEAKEFVPREQIKDATVFTSSKDFKTHCSRAIADALLRYEVPWRGNCGFPRNVASRQRFDGVLPLLFNLQALHFGWRSSYWGTQDEWQSLGGSAIHNSQEAEYYNLDQVEGDFAALRSETLTVDYRFAEKIIYSTQAKIEFTGKPGTDAAYYYAEDKIVFPSKDQFLRGPGGLPGYYNSLFHEILHWTETRLKWTGTSPERELRAEIGADYICTELAIPCLDMSKRTNHRNHIEKWVAMLREDPDLIFRITAAASKAVDFIFSFSRNAQPRHVAVCQASTKIESPITLIAHSQSTRSNQGQRQGETGTLNAQQPAELSPEQIKDLRQRLTAYAASLLSSDAAEFTDFGNSVTITDTSSCSVFHMSLETTWEKRQVVGKEKPFDGRSPTNPTISEHELDVWSYNLPPDSNLPAEYSVSGSDKTLACERCGASGKVSCCKCDGSGYLKCQKCKGTRRLRCSACKGYGYSERKEMTGQKKVRCSTCRGYGYKEREEWVGQIRRKCTCSGGITYGGSICTVCNGCGWELGERYATVRHPCTSCSGTGSVSEDVFGKVRYSCGTCDGKGDVECSTCYTDGTVDCGTCKKSGTMCCSGCKSNGYTGISYLAIKQSYSSTTAAGCDTDSQVPQEMLERLLTASDYHEVLNVSERQFSESISSNWTVLDGVKKWVQNAIADSHESTISGTRIVKQRLTVSYVSAFLCRYTYCGKEYSFASFGERKVPFARNSPVTEYLAGKKELNKLRQSLMSTFHVWAWHTFGGLPGCLWSLSLLYLFVWTPIACVLYWVLQPEDGTFLNSLLGLWWPGIGTSAAVAVGTVLSYSLFADKSSLEKKKAEFNAPLMVKIKALEGELESIRHGRGPDEQGHEGAKAEPNGTDSRAEQRMGTEQASKKGQLSESTHDGQGGALPADTLKKPDEPNTSGSEADSQPPSFSAWRAYLFFGLWVGIASGVMVGFVAHCVGGWFDEWRLIFRIPASLFLVAILATIAGFVVGIISGGILGIVTAPISTIEKSKMALGAVLGTMIGVVGGFICVFMDLHTGLITGGVAGAALGGFATLLGKRETTVA